MNAYADPLLDPRLRPYLKDVQAWHGYVRFLGLPTLQDHPDTPLHELFVPPLLSKYSVSTETPTANWPKGEPVLATLHEAKRLVVLGDPGSGKSVLVNWLAWLLVSGVEERVPEWLRGCIPLPLVLREMELGGVKDFDSLLDAFLKRRVALHLKGQKDLLVKWLQAGRVLVLADGLDEVGSGQREGLRDALWDGFAQYPESYFFATSRLVGYEDCPVDWRKKDLPQDDTRLQNWRIDGRVGERPGYWRHMAELLHIMPFDDDRIRAFAVNWYRLRSLKPTADSDAEQFIKALFRDETTRSLARNPQLLTLMALVYRVRAQLPDGRALLYDLIAEAYLESIDQARNITTSAADAAPWREKRRWLARVGFELQYRRMGTASSTGQESKTDAVSKTASVSGHVQGEGEQELLATRKDVLGWLAAAMHESGYSANPGFVDSYLHWVARRSGLLLPRGEELFAFVHLSFQEYFAALYLCEHFVDADWVLAQRDGTSATDGDARVNTALLRAWAKDPRWQDTLVFCFENFAFQPKDAKRLLGWLFGDDYQDFLNDVLQYSEDIFESLREAGRAELLARILTNPHTGLTLLERGAAFNAVWQYMEQAEHRFNDTFFHLFTPEKVLNRLLASDEWAGKFWQRLIQYNPLSLNLIQSTISDLSTLVQLTGLHKLLLDQTAVSDLSPLVQLPHLQKLYLDRTAVSDLSPLAQLTDLKQIDLGETNVSDLSPLEQLTGLQWLSLSQTAISDLSPLAKLTGLQRLSLSQTAVSDLSPLAGLTGLQSLFLNQTAVSDLSPLAQLTRLLRLSLDQTAVSDISPLAQLTGLQTLSLNQTAVSDLSPLLRLPNLKDLYINGVQAPIPTALRQRKGLKIDGP